MARVGGRNAWLAWPVGVLCLGAVAALVWLAAPGVPGAVDFVGETLRGATSTPEADANAGSGAQPDALRDCRDLYPERLWAQLVWTPRVLLSQSAAAPATSATTLTKAVQPAVMLTCVWRIDALTSISTTLARVDASAKAVAEAALAGQGFACAVDGDGIRCTKTAGPVVEEDVFRGGLWLSSQFRAWHPDGFTDQLVGRLW